jgi:hypothetical protein
MDFYVHSYVDENTQEPIKDFQILSSGELALVFGEQEEQQRAFISAFTQKGSIPQLPMTGVEWAELLVGERTPSEINSQIMDQLHNCADTYSYLPKYTVIKDQLIVTISKGA